MRVFYVYILTDRERRILYTGMTNHLERRLYEHGLQRNERSYSARYGVHYLAYFETHSRPAQAYAREREIKQMSRAERDKLIQAFAAEENACAPQLRISQGPPLKAGRPGTGKDQGSNKGPSWSTGSSLSTDPLDNNPSSHTGRSSSVGPSDDSGPSTSPSAYNYFSLSRRSSSQSGTAAADQSPYSDSSNDKGPSPYNGASSHNGPSGYNDPSSHDSRSNDPAPTKKSKIIPRKPICPW